MSQRAYTNDRGNISQNNGWDGMGEYNPFSGNGQYMSAASMGQDSFGDFAPIGGGGGGGTTYTPPVNPNPIYVPPSFNTNGIIKISSFTDEPSAHFENNNIIGVGKSAIKSYTFVSFGQLKTYKVNITGKIPTNYFTVNIEKKFNNQTDILNNADNQDLGTPDTNKTFNPNNQSGTNTGRQPGASTNFNFGGKGNTNDNLSNNFSEIVSVKEYQLSTNGVFEFKAERKYELKSRDAFGVVRGLDNINVDLNFTFKEGKQPIPADPNTKLAISFDGNYTAELGDRVTLSYDLVDTTNSEFIKSGVVKLSDSGNDPEDIPTSNLNNSNLKLRIDGLLPSEYSVNSVYYTNLKFDVSTIKGKIDFTKWTKVNTIFEVPGKDLKSDLAIYIVFDKAVQKVVPTLSLPTNVFNVEVKDSDPDKSIVIPFDTTQADTVDVAFESGQIINLKAEEGRVILSFRKNFNSKYGVQKIKLIAKNEDNGTNSNGLPALINFLAIDNFPSIIQTTAPAEIDVPSFSDFNIEYDVLYKAKDATSVDVDLILKDKTRINLYKNTTVDNKIKINLKELSVKYPGWNGSDSVKLIIKPYNRGGDKELVGNEYEIVTTIKYPSIQLDETLITKAVYDAFAEILKIDEPEKESKYLTHLLNLDNDNRILISSYEEDNWTLSEKEQDNLGNTKVKKEVQSVILKLYNPLPANVLVNDTIWITKLLTNPLIETIVLNEQAEQEFPYIKGPNFTIDIDFVQGNSTNYESLDDLILSASSATSLIQTYLSGSDISAEDLNVEYVSGNITSSTARYQWDNFVHFSSAEERIKNFVYKLQLVENYENLIASASASPASASLSTLQDIKTQTDKKSQLIKGFDGFETFLFTSSSKFTTATSSSMTLPYSGSVRVNTTNKEVVGWYENIIGLATEYDISNPNYLVRNIPQYILVNPENENYLLFFSMIGHYFDTIYFYTKAIERSRQFGYNNTNTAADRLLFDYLKSFNWNARNLGDSAQLWEYLYGEDVNGNAKVTTPVKERTNEVWRRILNNLPYLLKHKGTRRGIHALMACYGIPSSNLSIMEFGGSEVSNDFESKLLVDDTSYALKIGEEYDLMYLNIPWKTTSTGRKPDTVEFFIKPLATPSGSIKIVESVGNWNIAMSGSGDNYGKIVLNYNSANNNVTSSTVPIFNGNYFGVCASRTISGSYSVLDLSVMQTIGDRQIFNTTTSHKVLTTSVDWEIGTQIRLGTTTKPTLRSAVDEFRLWETPLSRSRFEEHVYYPEMINGNHISSSTTDLIFRLDFEYPKDVSVVNKFINVAPTTYYSESYKRNDYEDGTRPFSEIRTTNSFSPISASAVSALTLPTYPYHFELINRNSVLEIPSLGASRYSTNKVRFSSQSLVADLSVNSRSTVKNYDASPIDSNRVGVFVSPTKELNFDIAKSIGANNLDDYIGDPSDLYNDSYRGLDSLRRYYFKRIKNPDIYEYINIVKYYEKAMFEDIKQMLPARAKFTSGILIEPHFLERSKYQHQRPEADDYYKEGVADASNTLVIAENLQYDVELDTNNTILIGENNQYEGLVDANKDTILIGENNQYDSKIDANAEIQPAGQNNQYETIVDAKLELPTVTSQALNIETNKLLESNPYQDVGFSVYAKNGYAIRSYYDQFNVLRKERILINLVTENKQKYIERYAVTQSVSKKGDPRRGFKAPEPITYSETKLVIQPYTGSNGLVSNPPIATGSITNVTPVDGYLPTHYKYVGDLTTGLQNSYFRGSKNTAATTLDGSSPVESFISNPNAIKVLPGRAVTEPIIKTDN